MGVEIAREARLLEPELMCYHGVNAGEGLMNADAQARGLRLRMYVLCSECARLIDLAEDGGQQRDVVGPDIIRHAVEEHAAWLEMLGINET